MAFRIEETGVFRALVQFLSVLLPASCVGNSQIKAADPVDADKLEHRFRLIYSQESDTEAVTETRVIHIVQGTTGVVKSIKAGVVVPCTGSANIIVDLLKDGVSILTSAGVITIDSGDAAYALVEGTVDDDDLVAGDVLEVEITADIGSAEDGAGVFVEVEIDELPA